MRPLRKDLEQQAAYYQTLSDTRRDNLSAEEDRNATLLKGLMQMEQQFKNPPVVPVEAGGQLQTAPVNPQDTQKKP